VEGLGKEEYEQACDAVLDGRVAVMEQMVDEGPPVIVGNPGPGGVGASPVGDGDRLGVAPGCCPQDEGAGPVIDFAGYQQVVDFSLRAGLQGGVAFVKLCCQDDGRPDRGPASHGLSC